MATSSEAAIIEHLSVPILTQSSTHSLPPLPALAYTLQAYSLPRPVKQASSSHLSARSHVPPTVCDTPLHPLIKPPPPPPRLPALLLVCRRVVATSSEAAITDHLSDPSHVHTEADWNNDPSIKNAYPTAKSQSERLAWQMYEEVKAAAAAAGAEAGAGAGAGAGSGAAEGGDGAEGWSFELVTICPSAVLGPILHKQHARTSPQVMSARI